MQFIKKYGLSLLFLGFLSCNNVREKKEKLEEEYLDTHIEKVDDRMNVLGLIGGTSWHSTVEYYTAINTAVNKNFGNNTNPPLIVYTINQSEVHRFQKENKWDSIANMLVSAGKHLTDAGAKSVMFCANTPHKMYDEVQSKLDIPVIHIADATAKEINKEGIKKVGFLGTKYSMQGDFITGRIEKNGIEVVVPEDEEVINELQRIIEEELTYGVVEKDSKKYVLNVISNLKEKGATGIVLGCTEFPLMIFQDDLETPIFDTTEIHSKAAVDYILKR
ncbi:amino acid racemase [Cellulophaga baltica]|uniref:aspartate/glutamate racemase family protein n=1 Tax=Cellulophaga TaxID=104264 RepID=UPI001C06ABEB|nr:MULTISPECIES: amino acid racemase [Cellulophaga]MBU2995416.1 amino acid racemase [Cellulophaga baltica]MDO6766810.1 amino acid racemase [Cellulophaga sp. 1_MG-2023]